MKRDFDEDARIHLGRECGEPTGYDNGDLLRRIALNEASTAYKISREGKVIGAIILWIDVNTNQNFPGNVFCKLHVRNNS